MNVTLPCFFDGDARSDPKINSFVVRDQFFRFEEDADFAFGVLRGVGSMDQVKSRMYGEIASNGTGRCLKGVRFADQKTCEFDGMIAFPHHGEDRSGRNKSE
jgi:hypothetical protein